MKVQRDIPIGRGIRIRAEELIWHFARSGGPGGQHVNKASTKAELRFHPAGSSAIPNRERDRLLRRIPPRFRTSDGWIVVTSTRFRDQAANRDDCLNKLVSILKKALHRPKPRVPTKPTVASRERRLKAKRTRARKKQQRRRPSALDD